MKQNGKHLETGEVNPITDNERNFINDYIKQFNRQIEIKAEIKKLEGMMR